MIREKGNLEKMIFDLPTILPKVIRPTRAFGGIRLSDICKDSYSWGLDIARTIFKMLTLRDCRFSLS